MPLLTQYNNSSSLQTYSPPVSISLSTSLLVSPTLAPSHAPQEVQNALATVADEMYSRAQGVKGLAVAINTIREKGIIKAFQYWLGLASSEEDIGFCVLEKECLLLTFDSTQSEQLEVIRQDMPKELVDLLGGEEEILKFPILELEERRGPTGYIDFVGKRDMGDNNVMWGRDVHGRLFVSFNREEGVITYFRRYSPLDGISDIWVYGGSAYAGPFGINIHQLVKEAGLKSIKPEYSNNAFLAVYNKGKKEGEYLDFFNYVTDYQNEIEPISARNMLLTMLYGHKGEEASYTKIEMAKILLKAFYEKMDDREKTTLLHTAITAGNQPMYDLIAAHHDFFKNNNPTTSSHYADKTVNIMKAHPEFLSKFKTNCLYEAQFKQMGWLMEGGEYDVSLVEADDIGLVEHINMCYNTVAGNDDDLAFLASCFNTARAHYLRPSFKRRSR